MLRRRTISATPFSSSLTVSFIPSKNNNHNIVSFNNKTTIRTIMSAATTATQQENSTTTKKSSTFLPRNLCWPDPDVPVTSAFTFHNNNNNINVTTQEQQQQESSSTAATNVTVNKKPSVLLADNVSGLHQTEVAGFFFPTNPNDVREIINRARRSGKKVAMRGTSHCMSGQNVCKDAFLIDFKYMNKVTVHPEKNLVTTEPGATWADLIVALNPYAQSPRTMQSYSSFSVGGTLSVNAHGITTDFSCVESVVSFELMTSEGEILTCRADSPEGSKEHEYFSCVLGGYGLFGILLSITLKTTPNDSLLADSFMVPIAEFPEVYESFLTDEAQNDTEMGGITVKLCRLNIITCDTVQLYLFRRRGKSATVGQLTANNSSSPREMSSFNRLIYKWLLPPLKEARYSLEAQTGAALDWTEALDKNSLMFETAEPLARLSNPLFLSDDTFILQEYFVPRANFSEWMESARKIYKNIFENETPNKNTRVQLLNTTIRFVFQDKQTALPYARKEGGSYAFVLYYRLLRSEESVAYLRSIHERFVEITLRCKGTFYLPYLHHYEREELLAAYPMFPEFVKRKQKLDPNGLFDSNWFRQYALPFADQEYREMFESSKPNPEIPPTPPASPLTTEVPVVSERRKNSFRALMNNVSQRSAFFSEFMINVFNVAASPQKVESLLSRCVWDPRNKDDLDIFKSFKELIDKDLGSDPIGKAGTAWRQVKQLSEQKNELTEETMRILTRLGKVGGEIVDYTSIGDHGKLVRHLQRELKMLGKVRILHEEPQPEDDPLVAVETGSSTPVGEFTQIDYVMSKCHFDSVPDCSADLITMNQGLHHLPQCYVKNFLQSVERILRPGGIFITREHDCVESLTPVADCAHMVFNCLSGVSIENERREIRAFRPISEWRRIITSVTGLHDSMVFELQKGDPTVDIMLAFFKPPLHQPICRSVQLSSSGEKKTHTQQYADPNDIAALASAIEHQQPKLPFHQTIERLPETLMATARSILQSVAPTIELVGDKVAGLVAPEEFKSVITSMVRQYTSPIAIASRRILLQTEHVTCRKLQVEAFPSELYHGFFALDNRVTKGKATPQEALIVSTVRGLLNALSGGGDAANTAGGEDDDENADSSTTNGGDVVVDQSNEPIEMFHQEIMALFTDFFVAFPQVNDSDFLITAGFPEPIVDAVHNAFPPQLITIDQETKQVQVHKPSLSNVALKIESKIDSETWFEMKRHMKVIIEEKPSLTFDGLLGREQQPCNNNTNSNNVTPRADNAGGGGMMGQRSETNSYESYRLNPWHAFLTAFLGSPLVKLPYSVRVGLRFYGIPEAGNLYDTAQEIRIARRSRKAAKLGLTSASGDNQADPNQHLPQVAVDELNRALSMLNSPIRSISLVGSKIKNVYDVVEVMKATYSGKDVTDIVRKKLHRRDAKTGRQFVLLETDSHLDSAEYFNYGLTMFSQYFYEDRVFSMEYRTLTKVPTENLQHAASLVKRCLRQSRHREVRKVGSGIEDPSKMSLHFWKLLEWMQVDIAIDYSTSLQHTPWYRYDPVAQFFKPYFGVMAEVGQHVFSKYGARAAFFSNGFATAAVPAVVMSMLFGQLAALAFPVRAALGDSYDDSAIKSRVLVHIPEGESSSYAWPISFRTHKSVKINPVHGKQLCVVVMPVFGEFTQLLLDLARHTHQNKATILDVDGNANKIMIKTRMEHRSQDSSKKQQQQQQPESTNNNTTPKPSPTNAASASALPTNVSNQSFSSTTAASPQQQQQAAGNPELPEALSILRKKHAFQSIDLISTYTATTDGVCGAKSATLYDFAALCVPVQELLDVIRACDQSGITIVQIFDFY